MLTDVDPIIIKEETVPMSTLQAVMKVFEYGNGFSPSVSVQIHFLHSANQLVHVLLFSFFSPNTILSHKG